MANKQVKRLYKSEDNRQLDGVLGGIAEYLNVDATVIRVAYTLLTFVTGVFPGLLAYMVLAIIMPRKSEVTK